MAGSLDYTHMKNKQWSVVKSVLPKLNVLTVNGYEVGYIFKIGDNPWQIYWGIGESARKVGITDKKPFAKNLLEAFF